MTAPSNDSHEYAHTSLSVPPHTVVPSPTHCCTPHPPTHTLVYPTHTHYCTPTPHTHCCITTHYCTSTNCPVHTHRGSQPALRELQCRAHQRWRQSGCNCEGRTKVENSNHTNTKEILFEHLMRNADVAALRMYCKMAIDIDGLLNMQKLGRKMLNDLPPEGVCVCVCVCVLTCACVCATAPLHVCILYAICLVSQSVWSVLLHHLSTTDCMNSVFMVIACTSASRQGHPIL